MVRRAAGEGTIKKRSINRRDGTRYVRWCARLAVAWDGERKTCIDGPLRLTQGEAREDLENLGRKHARGLLDTTSTLTVKQYLLGWLEHVALNNKFGTYRSYYQSIHAYILPRIGHLKLKQLRRSDVQAMLNAIFKDARERGKDGKATTRKARSTLHKAFEDAIDVLPYDFPNPARKVKIPAEQTKMMTPWTQDEAERFFAVARASRHWPILHTALTSGLREGELCALRWEDLEPVELEVKCADSW